MAAGCVGCAAGVWTGGCSALACARCASTASETSSLYPGPARYPSTPGRPAGSGPGLGWPPKTRTAWPQTPRSEITNVACRECKCNASAPILSLQLRGDLLAVPSPGAALRKRPAFTKVEELRLVSHHERGGIVTAEAGVFFHEKIGWPFFTGAYAMTYITMLNNYINRFNAN